MTPPPPTPPRGIRLKEKSLGIVRSCTTNPSLDLRIYFSHLMPPHFKIFFFRTLGFFLTTCLLAFNINIRLNSTSGRTPSHYIHWRSISSCLCWVCNGLFCKYIWTKLVWHLKPWLQDVCGLTESAWHRLNQVWKKMFECFIKEIVRKWRSNHSVQQTSLGWGAHAQSYWILFATLPAATLITTS